MEKLKCLETLNTFLAGLYTNIDYNNLFKAFKYHYK